MRKREEAELVAIDQPYVRKVLTANEYCESVARFTKSIRGDKKESRAFLQKAGILDDAGDLMEPFRS